MEDKDKQDKDKQDKNKQDKNVEGNGDINTKDKEETNLDIKTMFIVYFHEFLEVFISILIIRIAMEKEVNILKIAQASAFIGLITYFLENYNSNFNSNIKQGISFSVGSQMISTFMN